MNRKKVGKYGILGILFFLPVTFLILLYPATHNYQPLDIINENVLDIDQFTSFSEGSVKLNGHITVLGFLGKAPLQQLTASSNLKELVYDKFKGFKTFQIVLLAPHGAEADGEKLKQDISLYEDVRFLHIAYGTPQQIQGIFNSLKSKTALNENLATGSVFIIDRDLNQRGRIDDREEREIEKKKPVYGLNGYDCVEVAIIKNKMSEDLRILFTEYRQKRKGEFNSTIRRADDLKGNNETKG